MSRQYRLAVLNSHPIQYFVPLYRRLAQEPGIDLMVYYCSWQGAVEYVDPGFGERFKWDTPLLEGYRYAFLPNLTKGDTIRGFTSLVNPTIMRELLRHRYDALWIHGHSYATHLLAFAAARLCGTPILMRCETHLRLKRPLWKQRLRRPLMAAFYHLCSGCLAIGSWNAAFYRHHGVREKNLFLVPYTVDNDFFVNAVRQFRTDTGRIKAELGIPQNLPVILFASKLSQRKRPLDILRAYQLLQCKGCQAVALLVGSGEEEVRLVAYAAEHQLRNVFFAGFQNQMALPKLYAISDIFVLPSEDEPWGLVINEAMCAGLPVVATDEVGATGDLICYGQNGFIYPVGDVAALADALARLCGDAQLREVMGCRSLEIIQNWSYERCVHGIRAALAAQAA